METKNRIYYLVAETEDDIKEWRAKLEGEGGSWQDVHSSVIQEDGSVQAPDGRENFFVVAYLFSCIVPHLNQSPFSRSLPVFFF